VCSVVTTSALVYQSLVNVMFSETACEVLFERDADNTSVATIILESLIKVIMHLLTASSPFVS